VDCIQLAQDRAPCCLLRTR